MSVEEGNRLHAGNFKTLAAAQVFAHHKIIAANHIRARLGEFGAVALVSAARKLLLLGAHEPRQFIFI